MDNDRLKAIHELVSKRHPGALQVCYELEDRYRAWALLDLGILVGANITGSDVWSLYQACGGDIEKLHTCLMLETAKKKLQEYKEKLRER